MDDFLNQQYPAGLLSTLGINPEDLRRQQQQAGLLSAGLQLLAGSGYSPVRQTTGQLLGQAGMAGVQGMQQAGESAIERALRGMQVSEFSRRQQERDRLAQATQRFRERMSNISGGVVTPSMALQAGGGPTQAAAAQLGQPINVGQEQQRAAMEFLGQVSPETLAAQALKPPERVTLKPGEQVIEPTTGRVVAQIAPTPEKVDLGNKIAFIDPTTYKTISVIPKDRDPKDATQTELAVGKNFTAEAAPYIGISQAYTKIESAAKNKSPAGDLSLIFGYMKILDPGSVVREGEFATAQNTGSVPESISALYNRVISGQRLTDRQRADFLMQAQNLVRSQRDLFNNTIAPKYVSLIQSNSLNPNNVVFDPFAKLDLNTPLVVAPTEPEKRKRDLNQILFPNRGK
jgi:hypothetical protein